jgi:hypothetical protein
LKEEGTEDGGGPSMTACEVAAIIKGDWRG